MSHKNPRKVLADAIRYHACVSKFDRSPAKAMNTMIAALFNILGCEPLSKYHFIDASYYTDFKTQERKKEIKSISAMTTAYLELVKANEPFHDVLTELASEFIGRDGKDMGQFMTPPDLAQLTALMAVLGHLPRMIEKAEAGELIKVGDPTGSGTGSLLMAYLYQLRKRAPELLPWVGVYAVDLDVDMARATAIQLIYNCLIHKIDVAHITVWRENALTGNLSSKPMLVFCPNFKTQTILEYFNVA